MNTVTDYLPDAAFINVDDDFNATLSRVRIIGWEFDAVEGENVPRYERAIGNSEWDLLERRDGTFELAPPSPNQETFANLVEATSWVINRKHTMAEEDA